MSFSALVSFTDRQLTENSRGSSGRGLGPHWRVGSGEIFFEFSSKKRMVLSCIFITKNILVARNQDQRGLNGRTQVDL